MNYIFIDKIYNQYSLYKKIKLVFYFLRTKIICPKARLIRFPFEIRGKSLINLGEELTTGFNCRLEAFSMNEDRTPKINFGKRIQLNDNVHICAINSVCIGDNVLIASHVYISDNSHGCYKGLNEDSNPNIPPAQRSYMVSPVKICDNVWIGEGSIVMPGVTIGYGSVIGAHTLVNKDVPENSIAVGNPVKIIKRFNSHTNRWENLNK